MIALPVVIAAKIATLLDKTTSDFCALQDLSQNVKRTLGGGGREGQRAPLSRDER